MILRWPNSTPETNRRVGCHGNGSSRRARVAKAAFLALMASALAEAGPSATGAEYGDFVYSTSGSAATITGYLGAGGDVTVPANINGYRVAYLGGYAFAGVNLTNIDLPPGLISFQPSAFFLCPELAAINVDPANSDLCSVDGVAFSKSQRDLLQCPPGRSGRYIVPSGVMWIDPDAFIFCRKLSRLIIPASVTSIGNQAFDSCTGMNGFYFLGNAPSVYASGFALSSATVYYLPGKSGWGPTFAGCPAVLWNPQVQTLDASFGVQANRFGFTITGSSNLVFVVEVCTNLATPVWQPVQTNTLATFIGTNGTAYFNDSQWTNYLHRFYRLRSP